MRLHDVVTCIGLLLISNAVWINAADLRNIANNLKAGYVVERNGIPLRMGPTTITTYLGNITLENTGVKPIQPDGWSLYLCHDKLIHPMFYNISTLQYAGGGLILPSNFTVTHSKGCMFSFTPYLGADPRFKSTPIEAGQKVVIPIVASEFFVSKYSMFPNWYLANDTHTNLIPNTMDNDMNFVGPFERDIQYTRFINDFDSVKFSPIDRYRGYNFSSKEEVKDDVLPTPFMKKDKSGSVTLDSSWFIDFNNDANLNKIANYLQSSIKEDTGLTLKMDDFADGTPKVVQILQSTPTSPSMNTEAYTLQVNANGKRIIINGFSRAAVINGIHTLRSLLVDGPTLTHTTINDYPRLGYRGLELDLASNFFGPSTVKKVIDVMAFYKLNKLVLILGADEGWRLQMVPEVPELTEIGGKRCHDPSETNCLFSQLGSAPDGSDGGYFTSRDYEDLLKYANERNIEIIPSVNMAGKSRAAIKSMLVHTASSRDASMMLQDPADDFRYMTPTLFSDSAINPCMPHNSTLKFFEFVLMKIKKYHNKAGVPLKHIHIGGEDSPPAAWLNSTHCQRLLPLEKEDLYLEIKVNYSMAIGEIAEREGVKMIGLDEFFIAWPSRLPFERIRPYMTPFRRSRFPAESPTFDVITVSKQYDQLPQVHRPQHMADNDYKVIMQPADYFNLEFAPEPNPDMPGEYTARRRYINATRVFNFLPDNVCCNHQLSDEGSFGCTDSNDCLELTKKKNIIGIQASISTRHVKDEDTLFKLLLPRLIAYAERAWHKAPWEDTYKVHQVSFNPQSGPSLQILKPDLVARDKDWARVASIIGHKEYPRLVEKVNVKPNLMSPGARKVKTKVKNVDKDVLQVDTSYPGLIPQVKTPGSTKWVDIAKVTDVSKVPHKDFEMRTSLKFKKGNEGRSDLSIHGQSVTMPLVYQSYRQEILTNITNIRRQMAIEQERQMERARQMERLRQQGVNPFFRPGGGTGLQNQFGPALPPQRGQPGIMRQPIQTGQPGQLPAGA